MKLLLHFCIAIIAAASGATAGVYFTAKRDVGLRRVLAAGSLSKQIEGLDALRDGRSEDAMRRFEEVASMNAANTTATFDITKLCGHVRWLTRSERVDADIASSSAVAELRSYIAAHPQTQARAFPVR